MKKVIGLIGGIGSGKSSVAALLERHGARVLSGDRLGHEALREPDIRAKLVILWGSGILNEAGEIDRRRLAEMVFADPGQRRALEAVVHPWIERRLQEEISAAQKDPAVRFIVVDAAIMLETGWDSNCDKLVFVNVPRVLRMRRLAEQRGWTAKEVAAREDAQMSLAAKAQRADAVIENSGSLEALKERLDLLLKAWGLDRPA